MSLYRLQLSIAECWGEPEARQQAVVEEPGYGGDSIALEGDHLDDTAAILTEVSGRTIRRIVAADDEWTTGLIGHAVPAEQTNMMLGLFYASRRDPGRSRHPALSVLPPSSI